ncbi:hypothetical protein [Streptomyces sp. NBC_00847]|uniref:hypothetical protein n=1 Tax=unclassified Streptomyces TaxID=2593676 RepID=UPI00224D5EAA|nr:hypothetical protein [Streptomyces sp. NBC_00847]MCX4883939.1 hypothetical protein [Streptomyces sp. NBC_00847]
MTMTEYNDIVVQDGRLFFGAKKADGPAKGQPRWVYLVLGIETLAVKEQRPRRSPTPATGRPRHPVE